MLKIFLLISLSFFLSFNVKAQDYQTVEGVVTMTYGIDTLYKVYWLAGKDFAGKYFMEDITLVHSLIYSTCGKFEVRVPDDRTELFEIPEYRNQDSIFNYMDHYGGDVYYGEKDTLVIAFWMKAQVLKLDKKPCEAYNFYTPYSCPVKRQEIVFPIYILLDVIESKSLDATTIEKLQLKKYDKKSFPWRECS